MDESPYKDCDAIICDGAVRSGKTISLAMSFIMWAFSGFERKTFAICGKSVTACRRNVVTPLMDIIKNNMSEYGYGCELKVSKNELHVTLGNNRQVFYIFGGKDESSASLIQGVTLAGVLFDEVALMPKSFVEQALARCSVTGSKFWFSCNPEGPSHWFYKEWIKDNESKNAFHIHFKMTDNTSLSEQVIQRYQNLYSGMFYDRMVLGKWVRAEGLVYPMFGSENIYSGEYLEQGKKRITGYRRTSPLRFVSIDYGTLNPFSAGIWEYYDGIAYRVREYYHDGRASRNQLSDEEYYSKLLEIIGTDEIEDIIVDPSAASFITCIYNHGKYSVQKADNSVLDGIRNTATALTQGWIMVHESCENTIREFGEYSWDDKALGEDRPLKENDHAMDDIRYFVNTVLIHEKKWD